MGITNTFSDKVKRSPIRAVAVVMRWLMLHLLTVILGVVFALPLIWMVSSSLKSSNTIFQVPPQWIPNPFQWSNYPDALQYIQFFKYLRNTLIIALPGTLGAVASSALVGYGFSRVRWPGRNVLFVCLIATMILPYSVTMIPVFIIFRNLGWVGTFLPLIIPPFLGSAFNIFLVRQFMMSIPEEMLEAARIDGANELQIFLTLMLPLCTPVLAVIGLFHFIGSWSDYLGPLLYLRNQDMYTLAIGLTSFLGGHMERWELLMAASVVTVAPIIILFFFTQRTFIEGITLTGMKG